MKDLNKSNWDQLVHDVNEHSLQAVQTIGDLEMAIDAYIHEHDVHLVLSESVHSYYIRYQNEWLRLSWHKLRLTCPVVFSKGEYYKKYEGLMVSRLKKLGRVHRGVVLLDCRFK